MESSHCTPCICGMWNSVFYTHKKISTCAQGTLNSVNPMKVLSRKSCKFVQVRNIMNEMNVRKPFFDMLTSTKRKFHNANEYRIQSFEIHSLLRIRILMRENINE